MKFLAIFLIFFTNISMSAEWVRVSYDDNSNSFVDKNSMKIEYKDNAVSTVEFWLKQEFSSPQTLVKVNGKKGFIYDLVLSYEKIYCLDKKFEPLSITYKLKGEPLASHDYEGKFMRIRPDTTMDLMANFHCGVINKEPVKPQEQKSLIQTF